MARLARCRPGSLILPRITTDERRIGFHWASPAGAPLRLLDVIVLPDAEPERWLPTHLKALDDVLIEVTGRFGEILGGGRGPAPGEHDAIATAYRVIDRLCHEYEVADREVGARDDLRSGQIILTAALMSIPLRQAIGLMGLKPFDGELDAPGPGVVGGGRRVALGRGVGLGVGAGVAGVAVRALAGGDGGGGPAWGG